MWYGPLSLLLHAAIVAALLWVPREPLSEALPPPATIGLVFQGGQKDGPASTEPEEKSPTAGLTLVPDIPRPETPRPETPALEAPALEAPALEAPALEALAQPLPEASPPDPPNPPTPNPPTPNPPTPNPPAPELEAPPPPPMRAEEQPLTGPEPEAAARPSWPPTRPSPAPTARRPAPALRRPNDFPTPEDFSLKPSTAAPPAGAINPGAKVLSLSPSRRGIDDTTPYSLETDAEVGPDWRNALSAWVENHAYYPAQAARMGQDGTARVLVTAMADGRVVSVALEKRSGSPWLDLALEGLFRGAKLPGFPKQAGPGPIEFHFTMHYILVR